MSQEMREIIAKRTACMKVFEHADHTMTAAIYGTPVHYMKDGHWEEIDNRLEEAADDLSAETDEVTTEAARTMTLQTAHEETDEEENEGGDVANVAGNFKVRLSNKVKKKNMVRLGDGNRKLTWGFVNAHSVKRQILEDTEKAITDEETDPTAIYGVPHLESRVCYPEAFDGVDIRYTIGPASLKEDLILKHTGAVKAFMWRYAPGELRAVQEGADIVFRDSEGVEAYRLSAPYMKDAAGAVSHGLTLTLTDDGGKKNKEVYVALEADAEWLNAEDRTYPVTIDPVVSTPLEYDKIEDCHVSSCYHTDNFYDSFMLKTGRIDGSTLRSYMKFQLPSINRADQMVISAWFYLTKYAGSGSARRYIDVHKVKQSWDQKKLTWDNKPDYDPQVIDFTVFKTDDAAQQGFDITNLVKDWYLNGGNYGLMIKDHEEEGHYTEYLSSDTHSDYKKLRPRILIQYVNYSGIEDYWTYHSQSAGRAGNVQINDYTGNLILVHDTLTMSGSRLPITLSHVYNSSEAGEDIGYGKGFRLNYYQTIQWEKEDETAYYRHIDGDGTAHWFSKDDKGVWKDELGLEETLTIDDKDANGKYIITDKKGMRLYFAAGNGRLTKMKDANGNTLRVDYTGSKITQITDPSGRSATLIYGSDGHLSTVKAPSGQQKKFAYDGSGRLVKITDVDDAASTYSYNEHHMLTKVSDPYGYSLQYAYARPDSRSPWRVTKVMEKAGQTEGMSLSMDYGYNSTKFTDEKGRSEYYLFDNSGHTVSVRDDNGRGAAWKYSSTKASRLSAVSDLQYTPVQKLVGSYDGLKGWNGYGSSSAVTVGEDTGIRCINKKSIRFTSSDASAYGTVVQTAMLSAGKTYVFSVYGRAEVTERGEKAAFWLQAQKEDQTEISRYTENIRGNHGWKRMQLVFKVPSSSVSPVKIRIVVRSVNVKGKTWLDGFQLEEGESAGRFNLMTNVCFDHDMQGYVKAANCGELDRVVTLSANSEMCPPAGSGLGRNVFMAVGGENENKRLVYDLDISGKKGDCYMASAWGRGESVPLTEGGDKDMVDERKIRHYGICVNFYNANEPDETKRDDYHFIEFGADTENWQYLNEAAVARKDYTKIQVMYCYNRNANRAYFTGLSLFKERYGHTFVYDEKGNVIKATDKAQKNGSFEYDSNNNLKKLIDARGNAFQYDYDDKHNVKGATSAAKMRYTFAYDNYGNPTMTRTADPSAETDATKGMTSKATYITGTGNAQYMATQTAPEGSKITYEWDATKGQLKKTTDAIGQAISYTYDTAGRIICVEGKANAGFSEADIIERYTYEKDRLVKIRHHGCDYTFAYDGFGNGTEIAIAGTKVISHSYGEKNGLLTKSVWGNGWEISYSYDHMDRLTGVTAKKDKCSYPLYTQVYDRQGRLCRYVDQEAAGRSCTYGYDLTGRLCEADYDDGTAYRYTYDANDCLIKENHTTPSGSREIIRAYDTDSREISVTCGSAKVEKIFDKLGRLSSIKRNNGKYVTTFTYMKAPDGGETGRVTAIKNGSQTISYGYDARGYVTSETKNGKTHRYHYDAKGQLVREEDPAQGKTFLYNYDTGGTLAEIRAYALTNAEDLTGLDYEKKTFAKGGAWTDQMMSVDGQACAYDEVGNLLTDGKRTYTWKNGNQLGKVTGDGLEVSYQYDASGIRTSKTVNGEKTEYLTAGSKILAEKRNGIWQHYLYDGDGQLAAITYKRKDYYYIRDNLRTITSLVDSEGKTMVNYSYDSWGRLLGITGSMAASLGKDNPYRYKGYYYDEETGMYYLKSRYYYPEICRFISADAVTVMIASPMSLGDKNLYAYCDNDPVNKKDEDGDLPQFVAMGIIGAVANVGVSFITAKALGQDYGWENLLEDAMTGALCALPATSMIAGNEKKLEIAGRIIMLGKTTWLAISGYLKGYSIEKTALYTATNIWLETPNFSGINNPEIYQDLLKQIGLNSIYELGFSSLRSGVNAGFDMISGKSNNKNIGNQSKVSNKSTNKCKPPANAGYKNGIIPIASPIDYILNMSHLKK